MSFSFSIIAKVPDDTVSMIGVSLVGDLLDRLGRRAKLSEEQLDIIQYYANKAIINLVEESTTTVDGYCLTNKQIGDIVTHIKSAQRIQAIKAFFEATGAGLKASKNFIDKFQMGEKGANKFMRTFQ